MFTSIGLECLNIAVGNELKDQLMWEFVKLALDSLLVLIDEHLGGKADRKLLEKTKYTSALHIIAIKVEAHDEVIRGNESLARSLYSAFKVVGEEKRDYALVDKAINGFENLIA